ncbi:MAG: sensor histidine kinase [Gammaproteobacteria bacterium]
MFLPNESLAAIERATRRKISLPVALLTVVSIVFSAWLAYSHKRIENLNLDLSRRAEQALASNEAKSRFLANMSHEIRTPLNAVLGLAYLLEKANITRDASEMATKIRAEGRSLLHIINGILDFSKIEAGQLELERAPFKLSELLDRLSTTMSINVGSKPIELTITPPGIPLEQLYGDALRLEQILTNLTSNAIKFTHQDMSISPSLSSTN